MDPTWKAIFFIIAVVLFAVEAFLTRRLGWAGLAAFALPFAWDAVEAA